MASNREEPVVNSADYAKRPKLQRACDLCRKKKIRCDGSEMPNSRCSKCISYGVECTYEAVNRRPPTKSYVEILESRLQKMEELVDRLQPRNQRSPQGPNSTFGRNSVNSSPERTTQSASVAPPAPPVFNSPSPADSDDLDPSDDEMETWNKLLYNFRKFSLQPVTQRYHGKSSSMMLLQTAVDMKNEVAGLDTDEWLPEPTKIVPNGVWALPVALEEVPPHTDFPPDDVMRVAIDAYFEKLNLYIPLLHKPTFDRLLQKGTHLKDEGFGSVVLLVLANGSRVTDDPRIAEYGQPYLPGWNWFLQVEKARKSIFAPPNLYDLQKYVLMSTYLGSYSSPHNCWTAVGIGLRTAQDLGAHRQKTYASMPKAQAELYKRAFWALLLLDRMLSFSLGRPCALQDEDFDAEPLIECDDEYWDTGDPATDFKQPADKPSVLTFMNAMNRIMQIIAFSMRTIYSINKSKMLLGFVGQEWEERTVAELDSLLNRWVDTVPDFLRWDPHRENLIFLNQSSVLYAKYYQLQIFIHRPFLPSSRKTSRLSLPSLAICTNAARSCIHVCDVQTRRNGVPLPYSRMPLFTAGIVLLINMWGGKRSGLTNSSAVADVQKCMAMLKMMEYQSRAAGRLWDVLRSLYEAGNFKEPEPGPSRKRPRDAEQPAEVSSAPNASSSSNTASSSRPSTSQTPSHTPHQADTSSYGTTPTDPLAASSSSGTPQLDWAAPSDQSSPASFDLPVRTEDLERMPFNTGFSPFYDPQLAQQHRPQEPPLTNPLDFPFPIGQRAPTAPSEGGFSRPPDGAMFSTGAGPMQGVQNPAATPQAQPVFQYSMQQQQQQQLPTPAPPQPEGLSTMGPSVEQPDGALPCFSADELALADNTLDMWSTAPTNLDWADWGAFVNSFSGAGGGPGEWPSEPVIF